MIFHFIIHESVLQESLRKMIVLMCESERNDDASVEGAGTPLKRQLFYDRMIRGSADLGMCESVFHGKC